MNGQDPEHGKVTRTVEGGLFLSQCLYVKDMLEKSKEYLPAKDLSSMVLRLLGATRVGYTRRGTVSRDTNKRDWNRKWGRKVR